MNKVIVCTTINPPTDALHGFCDMNGWKLVVVGDQKTPHDIYVRNEWNYLSPNDQIHLYPKLSESIPWNCIQRRNLGLAYALNELGADLIATVDDDNIPSENWGETILAGRTVPLRTFQTIQNVFDPLSVTNQKHLRHRGFPLRESFDRNTCLFSIYEDTHIDVQANLWNGAPDIDAILRIAYPAEDVEFEGPFPYTADKPSPFNSQNTLMTREAAKHYFLFPFIGRYDDIWASYHVQFQGFRVAYCEPTVWQTRNWHSPLKDIEDEIFGYEWTNAVLNRRDVLSFLPDASRRAFDIWMETIR